MGGTGGKYDCIKCGSCCRSLSGNAMFSDLDRGDGICRNYSVETRLCRIYETRPVKCNTGKFYDLFFSRIYTWDEFVSLNTKTCIELRKQRTATDNNNEGDSDGQ